MLNLNLNLKLSELETLPTAAENNASGALNRQTGIAVIGIDAKLGSATTKEEIWQAFSQGMDMITEFPEQRRKDAQQYSLAASGRIAEDFTQKAFLPQIDQFDPGLFQLSPMEAELMDPAQRIYLESAWSALEDAGYGGSKLSGSKTGVYVGYNSMGGQSEVLLRGVPKEALGVMVSGNVNAFLASRISYLLNLTGPAMIIDTACSSALVALHEACKALQRNEIDTAIVGSVRIFLCPERSGEDMGTTSPGERTKTFDESADGTGGGEGVINLVLKPLKAAVEARDHIYGVIKGSCINQDGSSIGITAPNSAAQEEVIVGAWNDAGIDPESISYVEAHGTATKLGDPVEIGGLTGAFRRFTDKKQFCAIGAAKSNFGHLDCAAGLVGVLKVLLMMEHRVLPPTLHFHAPNRKIDYILSPVYVNDRARPWVTADGVLTAGVSAFGLSGTNCHVVMQSFPPLAAPAQTVPMSLLTVSAREKETLKKLLLSYQAHLRAHPETELESFCYTVNTGRGQYRCRFAMVLENMQEFLNLTEEALLAPSRFADLRNAVQGEDPTHANQSAQAGLNAQAQSLCTREQLHALAKLYLQGAQINFEPLYADEALCRLSVPTYPFRNRRCWYTATEPDKSPAQNRLQKEAALHPLLDRCCLDSYHLRVYEKQISRSSCMLLREHRIHEVNVMPGTAYVEMAHRIGRDIFGSADFEIAELTFFSLLTCQKAEQRMLHAIAEMKKETLHIRILSRGEDGEWVNHVEATLKQTTKAPARRSVAVQQLLESYRQEYAQNTQPTESDFVRLGEHWQTGKSLYLDENSVVLCSEIPSKFETEAEQYALYPPILDGAVNAGMALLDGQYLPLNYKNARFYGSLRGKVYSHVTAKAMEGASKEVALFRIEMFDEDGALLGEVEEYALKRVNEAEDFLKDLESMNDFSHTSVWVSAENEAPQPLKKRAPYAAVLLTQRQTALPLVDAIQKSYEKTVLLYLSGETRRLSDGEYCVRNTETDISEVLRELALPKNATVIDLLPFAPDAEDISEDIETKLRGTFYLAKALCSHAEHLTLAVVAEEAAAVTGREAQYHPLNQSVIGFCSCLGLEQSNLSACILDTDTKTAPERLLAEIEGAHGKTVVGYRENCRYFEQLQEAQATSSPIAPQDGDTLIFAGGYGGIGLAISEYLLRRCPHMRIVLLSRTGERDTDGGRKTALDRLRAEGYSIEVMQADVTDAVQTEQTVHCIRQKYGSIDGVIMAAGVAGDGMLVNKSWETALKVLQPKLLGTWNLDRATQADALKYFILFSSVTSAFGSAGQSDYAAANAYLDSFTLERNRRGKRTMTVNWTGWKDSGMAHDHHVNRKDSPVQFVTDEEGQRLFERALELALPRVLLCRFRRDLPANAFDALQKRISLSKEMTERETAEEESFAAEAPVIYGKSPDKLTEVEKNIALAWARTLRVEEVNLYDKFFEAGGNSLLASYLQKEINRIYPDAMAITDVFVYSTIADIAAYIAGKLGIEQPNSQQVEAEETDIEDLVQKFVSGKLSLEEMELLV